jgi:hypothetical protein
MKSDKQVIKKKKQYVLSGKIDFAEGSSFECRCKGTI